MQTAEQPIRANPCNLWLTDQPGDRHLTFAYDHGGEPVINQFTTLGVYLAGDFDRDNYISSLHDVVSTLYPPPAASRYPSGRKGASSCSPTRSCPATSP